MASPAPAFLDEILPGEAGRLAIFGKHPTAADHLEDIGLASASLVSFKQGFYVEAIGECLARQAWAKDLGSTDSIPYDHAVICVGRRGWIMARFQHSSDAPGRRQFPLVLALHGSDLAALNRVGELGQALDAHLAAAAAAKEPAALRQVHSQAQTQLQELLKTAGASPSPGQSARESWLQSLAFEPNTQGLWRTCHALSPKGAGAGRARVPLSQGGSWQSAALWLSFVRHLLDNQPDCITLLWRQRQPFGDIALTPPNARVLMTLFAGEASQPLTATVPFNLSDDLKSSAESVWQTWLQDKTLYPEPDPGKNPATLLNKVCNNWRGWFRS